MTNNKIECNILYFFLIRGFFLLFFFHSSLLDVIISGILSYIIILIYQKFNIKKFLIFKIILLIFLLILTIPIIIKASLFINYNILRDFSYIPISISFIIISLYLAIKGYHSIIKSLEISLYIVLFISLLSFILLLSYFNFNNLNDILKEFTLSSNILTITGFNFLIYLIINYITDYKINYKIHLFSYFNILFIKLLCIIILNRNITILYKYPYINILKNISYLNVIERMEGILSIQYLFDFTFLMSIFLLGIKFLIKELFKIKKLKIQNIILSLISLIILIISISI